MNFYLSNIESLFNGPILKNKIIKRCIGRGADGLNRPIKLLYYWENYEILFAESKSGKFYLASNVELAYI